MAVYKAQTVVTNYLDVSTNAPKNPVNGQKWMDGTVMKTWDEIKKEWIADDLKGEDGIPGEKGADGRTQYTHIAYSNSSDGTKNFSLENSNRDYIGMYVDFNENDSTKPSDYSWTLIKGADGTQGTPGKPGEDGKTPYFHTAWANSADGKIDFSTTISANKKYLGTFTDFIQADSNEPSKYSWSLIKGADGKDGVNGKDGTDGKDGVTPKDVISGYLSNESIIVPATSAGTVTDYSKAFGDFIVFEGQTKKTSGVTYSKVSEVGMTSSINSAGRYIVSALSADSGTATYRATYLGVTIDKIMIVVKNKQGPSGANGTNGADGKDGSQGPQGVPGKDGVNGKDGATGPQGPPTGITTSATVPTSPYVGMLWQNTGDVAGYLKGVTYRWNGAKWDIYIFRAENIAANSLSAISANLGTITAGEILTSFFRGDSISSAVKKRGTTSISDGQFRSSFDYVQVTNNTVLGKGDVVLDENGFMIRDLTTSNEVLRSVSYKPDKIIMTDANFSYGEVNLKYQDLLNLPQISLEGINGWEKYATSGGSAPMAERNMRTVTLTGAFKPVTTISHTGLEQFTVCVLPIGYRPKERYSTIAPGSGIRLALINVEPNGAVTISRNRDNNGYVNYNAGGWYSIACSFSAADI